MADLDYDELRAWAEGLPSDDVHLLILWEDYSEWMDASWITVAPRTNSLESFLSEGHPVNTGGWPSDRGPGELDMMREDLEAIRAQVALARSRLEARREDGASRA